MKTTTLPLKHSMNRAPFRFALLLIPLALACFPVTPQARATCQQGCLTNQNTALGDDALISNTGGDDNTAVGYNALFSNTDGSFNTATGFLALLRNTTGGDNTAFGATALSLNTTGIRNTAIGSGALQVNNSGNFNTAIGQESLQDNTTGSNNTAMGVLALASNTTGGVNTATGASALQYNTTGIRNTANGTSTLINNTSGSNNTAVGDDALQDNATGSYNTAIGNSAMLNNKQGSRNVALGNLAGIRLSGNDNIAIANPGVRDEFGTIRIGTIGKQTNAYITGISGATVPTGVAVIVDADGHLGTITSSARFKEAIKPMDKASDAILELKPVTFRYKHELDPAGAPQFGLVAEEVAKVNSDLVARDEKGKPYTVRYEAVNVMLLNEFLKEHQTIQELKKQVAELTAGLQKVSAQLEASKASTQMVVNNR
jgi:hypothetical protein